MYNVFPSLIPRAAMVRARALELGRVNDYYTSASAPSSSTLVAAAPSATNVYVLAYGEREGLAPGERLEVSGKNVRLVRTLAYGCPRGVTVQSAFTGRLSDEDLNGITEQLDALHPCGMDMRKLAALQLKETATSSPSCSPVASTTTRNSQRGDAAQLPRHSPNWTLRLPEIKGSRVLRNALPDDVSTLSGAHLTAQLERMRRSQEEVVVAEWVSRSGEDKPATSTVRCGVPEHTSGSEGPSRRKPSTHNANTASNGGADEDVSASDALLVENGVCFRSADSCGLRALRTARLAFIASIERTANGLARRQRRLPGEELRALEVLDVSAIDFTFAHAALQSTLELGLHTGEGCRITHVPLTDAAAQRVESPAASYIRIVAAESGTAFPRPFDFVPTHSFGVGAYTAYLPLPLGPYTTEEAAGSCASFDAEEGTGGGGASSPSQPTRRRKSMHLQHPIHRRSGVEAEVGGTRLDRQQLAVQLSQAMATLRRGACMLVTFVPTPATAAALYRETEAQHHAEVLMEHRMVANSKACIAEAISRTGRWGYITDEVLPAVDSPQGSSFSLMVVLE
ncbi:putative mitochondrial hypothetical protein [Leptomonas pyrrhocoris]|uniref:Uncharacterized protein n=1 Tax=Leptomonas pyrrhocoris TaxID=157538 RepID=A0A0M9FXU1_LEPPY|nr:putative mitochondrial hypothetical protein [Leptomonas pyrrhocoris]XP_015656579.1 putative mitochondrial hypothetical protein [Leptomonas pyrrhocoris]XP_015656580.1 putative mitochondrial hypothetical protein [Leptomonas pyrrhocoris]KPA78139.1 putative mitochondrial hypothetical protein [Leptomonas pyrrhocoris]KPA78140.1 putative mitochondrial hypothetical protein [Leptomonas pyrrhocoris]KPA78141.1 putative mitochondrial hypothetical protein [Leptomonas pyrrhocoris]|eukprot:XP_015656578.1 putative mitochondrial hypothetical protein [Leptomonas pyrrhocoris]